MKVVAGWRHRGWRVWVCVVLVGTLLSEPLLAQTKTDGSVINSSSVVVEERNDDDGAAPLPTMLKDDSASSLQRGSSFQRERRRELPLSEMNLEQMKEAGYLFAREQTPLLSSQAVRMSLTLGTVIHGIGHLMLEDYGTGFFLLGMEVAGILLVVGGALLPELYEESPGLDILATTMVATGIPMLVSSWLFDLSGTFRAEGLRLGTNSASLDGLSVGLGYRLLRSDPSPVSHVIDIDLSYDHRWFRVRASTLQDVELNYQSYGLSAGALFLRDAQQTSELGLSAFGEYNTYVGLGEYREIASGAKIFGLLDLGHLFPTLNGTSLGVDLGWDLHFPYVLDDAKRFQRIALRQSYMYYFYSRFGISDSLTFTLGYRRREDVLVSPQAIPFGTFVTEFRYLTHGESDISLGFEVSEGFVVWIKGRINLYN